MNKYETAIKIFTDIRDLPYHISTHGEIGYDCEDKAKRLISELNKLGIPANIDARNVFDQLVNKGLVNRTFLVNNNGGWGEEKVIYKKSDQIEYLNNLPTYNLKEIRKEVQKNVEKLYGQGQIPINIYEELVSGGFN